MCMLEKRQHINSISKFYLKNLKKEGQKKIQSRRKEIVKMRAEVNENRNNRENQ